MADLLLRDIDPEILAKLEAAGRRKGRSAEEEAHEILRKAMKQELAPRGGLGSRIAARFAGIGLDEDIPEWRGEFARGGR